jgi:uncharacterized protein with HEPN domain
LSEHDDLVYVGHMLELACKVHARVQHLSRADFDAGEDHRVVCTHFLQTMGEAARRISVDFRDRHPQVPWHGIIGMRHHLVHDYMSVDYDLVWEAATRDVEPLIPQLEALLSSAEE